MDTTMELAQARFSFLSPGYGDSVNVEGVVVCV
jgi:hypothetical protein